MRIFLRDQISVDLEACRKNSRRYAVDIPRIIFLHNAEIGRKDPKSTGSWINTFFHLGNLYESVSIRGSQSST